MARVVDVAVVMSESVEAAEGGLCILLIEVVV